MSKSFGQDRVLPFLRELADEHLAPIDLPTTAGERPGAGSDEGVGPRYVERTPIGRGGLGEVVEAFDLDLRRVVALKRLRPDRSGPADLARLLAEAQITAQLEHPNIPPVHTVGVDDEGRAYFTMTRIRGISLSDFIRRAHAGPEPWQTVGLGLMLRIFLRVAYALAAAHARGVIHRDVKPDNIMVGDFGEVRLMDWGIAKVLARGARNSEPPTPPIDPGTTLADSVVGAVIGTPGYMAPEQAAGAAHLDERADVYALGATLYEMLSGQPPIQADSQLEKLRHTVDGTIVPLDEFPWVPTPLCALVSRALATDREDRYPSALALIADVESFLEGRPVGARDDGWLARLSRHYTSRAPRSMRLRFIDIDTLAASSLLIGTAIGVWTAPWLGGLAWLIAALGALVGIPFYRTWFRRPRPDDPMAAPHVPPGLSATTSPERPSATATTRRANPPEPADPSPPADETS
jgi:eukaryotic-like serine/threonine-protein kinase